MIPLQYFVVFTLAFALSADANVVTRVPNGNRFFKDADTLIVGGRPALQGESPYQLAIRFFGYHLCGASLVEIDGLQVGVTAGHCVWGAENYPFDLIAGDLNQADTSGIEQTRVVSKVVVHENYTDAALKSDIALLFFNQSFQLNDNVKTVPLPVQDQVTSEGSLKVSGWGDLEYLGVSPDELQIVDIPLVNDTYCQEAYQDFNVKVDDNMICAGKTTGDISPCHGDSGGPAISNAGYLAGIVSWGYECGHPNYPGVFTKVSHFVDWVHAVVRDHQSSS